MFKCDVEYSVFWIFLNIDYLETYEETRVGWSPLIQKYNNENI